MTSRGPDAVVVSGPATDADVLGHRDLNMIHVVAVPDRFEQLVGEAQRQHVLDGLFPQVVIDSEDGVALEDGRHFGFQLPCGRQVAAERLLDDDPAPRGVDRLVDHPVLLELRDGGVEELRRDRQVIDMVALGALRIVQLLEGGLQHFEGLVIGKVTADDPHALVQLGPDFLAEGRPGMILDGLPGVVGEVFRRPVASREADESESGGQEAPIGQVVDRRKELLASQIAGHPEHDEGAWPCNAGQPAILRVAQRVAVLQIGHSVILVGAPRRRL
jgi:hypothetical protein